MSPGHHGILPHVGDVAEVYQVAFVAADEVLALQLLLHVPQGAGNDIVPALSVDDNAVALDLNIVDLT